MNPGSVQRELTPWSRVPSARCSVYRPERWRELQQIVDRSEEGKLIAWGAGRSYGDAPLNGGHGVVDFSRLIRFLDFDEPSGVLRAEAGVTIEDILTTFVPRGWFPPVTPGTKFVTLGGAVAADIHGKNHHRDGSFSRHVVCLEILLADGRIVQCSRQEEPDLFWATLGGMGLTGFILTVSLRLFRIRSSDIRLCTVRTPDLDKSLATLQERDSEFQYSVAWIDALARGRRLGRGILMFGDHQGEGTLALHPQRQVPVPFGLPGPILRPWVLRRFNSMYFHRFPQGERVSRCHYNPFFYPLDALANWNRLYGRRGFMQYQCVLPMETSRAGLIQLLEVVSRDSPGCFLVVLKRFGPQEGLLSFPMPGYTLALDFPYTGNELLEFLKRLDRVVLECGGRVYLAKDSRLGPSEFRSMYPAVHDWISIKERYDPQHRFSSELSRRLCLAS